MSIEVELLNKKKLNVDAILILIDKSNNRLEYNVYNQLSYNKAIFLVTNNKTYKSVSDLPKLLYGKNKGYPIVYPASGCPLMLKILFNEFIYKNRFPFPKEFSNLIVEDFKSNTKYKQKILNEMIDNNIYGNTIDKVLEELTRIRAWQFLNSKMKELGVIYFINKELKEYKCKVEFIWNKKEDLKGFDTIIREVKTKKDHMAVYYTAGLDISSKRIGNNKNPINGILVRYKTRGFCESRSPVWDIVPLGSSKVIPVKDGTIKWKIGITMNQCITVLKKKLENE